MWKGHQLARAATFAVSSAIPGAAAVLSPIVVFVAAWDWVSQSPEGFFVAWGVSFLIVKFAMSWWYGDLRFLLLDANRVRQPPTGDEGPRRGTVGASATWPG